MHETPRIPFLGERIWLMLAAIIAACASNGSTTGEHKQVALPASTRPQTADAPAAEAPVGPVRPARRPDVALKAADPELLQRWRDTSEFAIKYARGGGATGRAYLVRLDQSGALRYDAAQHMALPGSYEVSVDPKAARALYDQVLDLGFLRLEKSYADESSDPSICGAQDPAGGYATHELLLTAAGEERTVDYENVCSQPGEAYEALRSIIQLLDTWPPLQPFVAPAVDSCYEVDNRLEKLTIESLQTSYVIRSEQDVPLGMLAFVEPPDDLKSPSVGYAVRVSDCQGQELFVTVKDSHYGCGFYIVPQEAATTTYPGVDKPVHAALIGVDKDTVAADSQESRWRLHLLHGPDTETLLYVRPGASCED